MYAPSYLRDPVPSNPLLAELEGILQETQIKRQKAATPLKLTHHSEITAVRTEEWNRWYLDYSTNAELWESDVKPIPTKEWTRWYLNYLSQAAFPDDKKGSECR